LERSTGLSGIEHGVILYLTVGTALVAVRISVRG